MFSQILSVRVAHGSRRRDGEHRPSIQNYCGTLKLLPPEKFSEYKFGVLRPADRNHDTRTVGRTNTEKIDMENTAELVHQIVADVIEVEAEELGFDDNLPEEHDVDSLLGLEILVALEKQFKVKIPEAMLQEMTTVNQICETLANGDQVVAAVA